MSGTFVGFTGWVAAFANAAQLTGWRGRDTLGFMQKGRLKSLFPGGGAVLAKENRDLLHAYGTVIYLRAPVKSLLKRTQRDRSRPLLQVPDPAAKLTELYEQRDPLYREVAHLIVDTGNQSVRTLAGQIEAQLKAYANLEHTLTN